MKCKIDSLFHSHPVIRIWLTVWKCYTNDCRHRTMVFAYVPPYRTFLWMPTATWWQRVNFCSLYRFFLFIYKVSNKFMKMIDIILHQQISKLLQLITVIQNQTFFLIWDRPEITMECECEVVILLTIIKSDLFDFHPL